MLELFMRAVISFAAVSVFLILNALATVTLADDTAPEVHAVGVYEGNIRTGGQVHGPEVLISVDRPGQTVVLALGSYDSVRFVVSVSAMTAVQSVILHGHGANQSEVLLNNEPATPVRRRDLPYVYQDQGEKFRTLVAELATETGSDGLASFHGSYRPEDGQIFQISEVQNAIGLKPVYLPELLRPELVPPSLRAVLEAPPADPGVRFTEDGFSLSGDGENREIRVSLDVPPISWPVGAAYDERGGRLFGVSLGGEGFLYQYSMAERRWSVLTSMNHADASGVYYDPAMDRLLLTLDRIGKGGMLEWTESGGLRRVLSSGAFATAPGFSDLYDPGNGRFPDTVILAVEGDLVVVAAVQDRVMNRFREAHDRIRLYLVNLETGAVDLVAYSGD